MEVVFFCAIAMSQTPDERIAIEARMLEVRRQIVAIDVLHQTMPHMDAATLDKRSALIDELVDLRLSLDC